MDEIHIYHLINYFIAHSMRRLILDITAISIAI